MSAYYYILLAVYLYIPLLSVAVSWGVSAHARLQNRRAIRAKSMLIPPDNDILDPEELRTAIDLEERRYAAIAMATSFEELDKASTPIDIQKHRERLDKDIHDARQRLLIAARHLGRVSSSSCELQRMMEQDVEKAMDRFQGAVRRRYET